MSGSEQDPRSPLGLKRGDKHTYPIGVCPGESCFSCSKQPEPRENLFEKYLFTFLYKDQSLSCTLTTQLDVF